MMKQTVYLNNFSRKSGFRLQFLRQSAVLTHHYWRGHQTSLLTHEYKFVLLKAGVIRNSRSIPNKAKQTLDRLNFETMYFFKSVENALLRKSRNIKERRKMQS